MIERLPEPSQSRFRRSQVALTDGARIAIALNGQLSAGTAVLAFDAVLLNAPGVGARLAIADRQHLTALHDAIRKAFGWQDDHLYSFWLDCNFWGDKNAEYTRPDTPDGAPRTADVPLAELDLSVGAELAYVFDFGDEWRVQLTLREHTKSNTGRSPRALERTGQAPPQYPGLDDE